MLKKLTSVTLVAVLVSVLCGTSAFANNSSNPDVRTDTANGPSDAPEKTDIKPNEQLKNNMLKLVADAKAGKVMPAAKSQIQPARSNNLSNGKKIAIGVGIACRHRRSDPGREEPSPKRRAMTRRRGSPQFAARGSRSNVITA